MSNTLLSMRSLENVCFVASFAVPADLTPEERIELENIRRRKQELLVEIQRLRDELSEAMNEVEGLEANEGRYDFIIQVDILSLFIYFFIHMSNSLVDSSKHLVIMGAKSCRIQVFMLSLALSYLL